MFFNLQRWSLHDGPGIRTTVFFQGCPLRCRWCSNPESWTFKTQKNSPTEDDVMEAIKKDRVFYRASGGGVTFSGGEPFSRPETLKRLAGSLHCAGIKAAVETSGYFIFEAVADIMTFFDDIFIDIKHASDTFHRELTGVSNKPIIRNIRQLDVLGQPFIIRIPLIRDITDTPDNITRVMDLCSDFKHLIRIELLPYHPLGIGKYEALNLPYDRTLRPPASETIDSIINHIRGHGLKVECSTPML